MSPLGKLNIFSMYMETVLCNKSIIDHLVIHQTKIDM